MEHALCRDPSSPNSNPLLRAEFETSANTNTETATLSFDRPQGDATVSPNRPVTFCGIFRYELKGSTNLADASILFDTGDDTAVTPQVIENSPRQGAVSQPFEIASSLTSFPKRFYWLEVTMRPES
jgi:hypothetical protein